MNKALKSALIIAAFVVAWYGFRYLYFKPAIDPGETSPAFTATLPTGDPFDLNDLKGSYVLLDFWGSWCGPCLKSYPELRSLYAAYHDMQFTDASGFQIVSIAIERDSSRWIRALDKLRPEWPYQILDQSSSLRFFNGPIADLYGVKQLPTKFLLGPDGEMIGTDWKISEIEEYLHEDMKAGE